MDYYEDDYDFPCPACQNPFTRWRRCDAIGCEDGWIDVYEDDPLWYDPGDMERCDDCRGTGIQTWCPKCGWDRARSVVEDEAD